MRQNSNNHRTIGNKKMRLAGMTVLVLSLFLGSCDKSVNNKDSGSFANAGDDQTTFVGSYAELDISKSVINEPVDLLQWRQSQSNPQPVNISEPSLARKSTAVFEKEGIYRFILAVRCTSGKILTDSVTVIVKPRQASSIEDVNLEAVIRYKLAYREGPLNNDKLLLVDSLASYYIVTNRVSSLKGIEACSNITCLRLAIQNVFDLSPLATLDKLVEVDLDQNWKIVDISPLANLTHLSKLNLQANLIEDISPLQNLRELIYLNLMDNPIRDLSPIGNLQKLNELWLAGTLDGNLTFLLHLQGLSLLWMTSCNVKDILPLKEMTSLRRINFDSNEISDLSPLNDLRQLEWLYLASNQIVEISCLDSLQSLSRLRLWYNQIQDISPLIKNNGLGDGDVVGLYGNPLNDTSKNVYIPMLRNRGVVVEW